MDQEQQNLNLLSLNSTNILKALVDTINEKNIMIQQLTIELGNKTKEIKKLKKEED